MKLKSIFLIALFVFAGCATTEQGMAKLTPYVGQNADAFFKRYGMPVAKFEFSDKDISYRWSSGSIAFAMPATTTVNTNAMPQGQIYTTAQTTGGGTFGLECIVDIITGPDNIVKSIKPVKDTIGLWVTSRCAEIF